MRVKQLLVLPKLPERLSRLEELANNLWYCADNPSASRPELPVRETGGVYGINPHLADPKSRDFQTKNRKTTRFGAFALPEKRSSRR